MALHKSVTTTAHGVALTFDDAYFVVVHLDGKIFTTMQVIGYTDNTKQYEIYNKYFTFTASVANDSPNHVKQGYEYLKTLPEFTDAIDVLEEGQVA